MWKKAISFGGLVVISLATVLLGADRAQAAPPGGHHRGGFHNSFRSHHGGHFGYHRPYYGGYRSYYHGNYYRPYYRSYGSYYYPRNYSYSSYYYPYYYSYTPTTRTTPTTGMATSADTVERGLGPAQRGRDHAKGRRIARQEGQT